MTERKVLNEITKRKKLQLLLQQGRALGANAFKKFEGGVEKISQGVKLKICKLLQMSNHLQIFKFANQLIILPLKCIDKMKRFFLHKLYGRCQRIILHSRVEVKCTSQKISG